MFPLSALHPIRRRQHSSFRYISLQMDSEEKFLSFLNSAPPPPPRKKHHLSFDIKEKTPYGKKKSSAAADDG